MEKRSLDRALDALRETMKAGTAGDRLPSIRNLARRAGVSTGTAAHAVRILKTEGSVATRPGGGAWHSMLPQPDAGDAAPRVARWREVRGHLLGRILRAEWAPGVSLPSVKELSRGHGADVRTVRKAVADLVRTGYVLRRGRAHEVPAGDAGQRRYSTLALLGVGTPAGDLAPLSQLDTEFVYFLEKECGQSGVALSVLTLDDADGTTRGLTAVAQDAIRKLERKRTVLGYVVRPSYVRDLPAIIERLSGFRKPVAIVDQQGLGGIDGQTLSLPGLRLYTAGNSILAGRIMARHLISLGHRRVAFIATAPPENWARNRCEGMQKEFADA